MADIDLKTATPDATLPATGFLFGADSQASASPSVYPVANAVTTLLGNAASADALVFNSDAHLTRRGAANLRLGAADAAAPVAQILSVQSVVAGTSNTAGAAHTITGSQGTGTGAGGSLIFQVAPAGSSGSAQNALADALTINADRSITVAANASSLAKIAMADRGTVLSIYTAAFGAQPLVVSASGGLNIGNNTGSFSLGSSVDVVLNRDAADVLSLKRAANAQEFRVYENTTGTIYKAILGNRGLMKISGAAFADGAGAQAGTLTNAPAVGNPTKWISIDDNGTTRYIPAW